MPEPTGKGGRLVESTGETVCRRGQEQVDEGLRILARLIARAYLRDQVRFQGNGASDPGEIPAEGSDPSNLLEMEQ